MGCLHGSSSYPEALYQQCSAWLLGEWINHLLLFAGFQQIKDGVLICCAKPSKHPNSVYQLQVGMMGLTNCNRLECLLKSEVVVGNFCDCMVVRAELTLCYVPQPDKCMLITCIYAESSNNDGRKVHAFENISLLCSDLLMAPYLITLVDGLLSCNESCCCCK